MWFAVNLLFKSTHPGNAEHEGVWEECLTLVRAETEEEARRARYAFYRDVIHSGQVTCVATGHTLSDQAETVLFRMLR